jgi:predicted DNA-binding protein (MmcQ/YjbR family)
MDADFIRDYALGKPGAEEGLPFGPDVIVFKVGGKVFLLLPLDTESLQFNVKCDPALAEQLRMEFPDCVLPGYHMNKKHWNTVIASGRLSRRQLLQFIDHSYDLVAAAKTKTRSR